MIYGSGWPLTLCFAIFCLTAVVFHAMPHILLSHQGDRGDIHEGPDQEEEEEEEEEGGKGELVEGEDLRDDQRHLEKSRTEEEDERSF